MNRQELEAKLRWLREAAARIGANLVELELDSSRQLLEASSLEGESATRWSAASAALTELWQWHGQLEGLLERADKVCSGRRLRSDQVDELRVLLEERSIELPGSDVPLAERDLLGRAEVARRCTPDELLSLMSLAFDEVKSVVVGIGGAWEVLIPRLETARRLRDDCAKIAEGLGESGRADLGSTARKLEALGASLTANPLAIEPAEVDALIRSLEALRRDLDSTAALKAGLDERMASARELLEQLRGVLRAGEEAHNEVLVKISAPAAPAALGMPHNLDARLAEIVALAESGGWREARRALERWTDRTTVQLEDAQRVLSANLAPIEARNQFRALLEAYQVKAHRLGLLEDPGLSAIFHEAREALFNAPTDLALVGQLVRRYQDGLRSSSPPAGGLL